MLSKLTLVGGVIWFALMYLLAVGVLTLGIGWLRKLALDNEYHYLGVALWWMVVFLGVLLAAFFGYRAAYRLDAGTLVGFATGVTVVVLMLLEAFVIVRYLGVPAPPRLPGLEIAGYVSTVLAFAAGGYVYGRRSRKSW